MKRLTVFTVVLFLVILLINYFYYRELYNRQVDYVKDLLGQQVAIIGSEVSSTNISFEGDLREILFDEDFTDFFDNDRPEVKSRIVERLKFYYSKYNNFIETIEYNGTDMQVFMLYRDRENDEWIANTYLAQDQKDLLERDDLQVNRNRWDLIMPVRDTDRKLTGNIILTVDYINYFSNLFRKYKLEDQQWQWLIDWKGDIIYSNYFDDNIANTANVSDVDIMNFNRIQDDIVAGIIGNIVHSINVRGENRRVISSYYSVDMLRHNFGMVFSAPADFYQIYIIRNSLLIVSLTLLLTAILILLYRRFISRQTYSAERLRESEQTFIRLIELLPVGVVVVDKNNEVLKANESAAKMFGYRDEKEMENKIMPETENSGQGVFFAENLGPGFEPDQFMVISRKGVDNVLYRKEIRVAYRGEHAIMIVLMDVTMLEVARKQQSQARDEKSEFLTRISHEIRTPLNGIIGMVDMLLKKENDDESQKIISLVKNSSDLLQEIINDLLDFSKLDEGNMVMDEIPYDIRKEIDYCFDVAGTQARGSVKMKHEIASSVPESVIGDPFRLRQVLTNLLSLSLEHTDEGEVLLEVGSENAGPGMLMLNFDLKDTGKGYDGMVLKKMFGDYIKTENKSISQYGSKGLGSILTKQLIEMMGGTITPSVPSGISDDPDAPGACFSFGVKVYSNIRTDKKYDAEKVRKFSDIKALVVSGGRQRDEELLGNLHKSGLTSYVTSWQKQTVNLIKSNLEQLDDRYKLIIIADSPDFDGFEVAETLYREELYKNFLIIMVSSNDERGNYARCIKYGIDDYIVKPYNSSELLNSIKKGFPDIKVAAGPGLPDLKEKDLSVLVVEDNLISQKVAATILSSIGLEADLASNGIEGLEKAAGRKYDIIFMDLIMPEMDGYTASKKILETSPDTLIIALSADISSESAKKAEIAGIREFVNKPVKKEDIEGVFIKYFSR